MDPSPLEPVMLAAAATAVSGRSTRARLSTVDIVVPVRRDDPDTAKRIRALHAVVHDCVPLTWSITIVDVGGANDSWPWMAHLSEQLHGVRAVRTTRDSRCAVLKSAWQEDGADIVVLLELDTPNAMDALLPLVAPLVSGRADLSVGSVRGGQRGLLRRGYNALLRAGLGLGDTRSGLLAVRADALRPLLGAMKENAPFLTTQLAMLARHNRLRVNEVAVEPVHRPLPWRHAAAVVRLLYGMVKGRGDLAEPGRATAAPMPASVLMKFVLFGIVGALSGVLYVLVYLPLRQVVPPAAANFCALVLAALFNIEVNRAWTFSRTKVARAGMHVRSAMLFVAHYSLTTGAVMLMLALNPDASHTAEVVTLLAADMLMTIARFIGLDKWVFRRRSG